MTATVLFDKKAQGIFEKMLEMHKKPIDKIKCLCYNKDEQRRTQIEVPMSI